ncbi:hypothetical protein MN116_008680 [Schistosoma mekongi]|uniref:Uncharacterized protein n=1 Tax=Schistosoma mekongi TaxID=38744 RepID=A0AAE1Z6J4_SCHME|nr:hypothetical protein MN116_008680 [Schistosoma mekongi]
MRRDACNKMTNHRKVPMFWICLTFTTFGFTCSFVSMVMPCWYARYPQSQNRFVRLGLWEVCFDGYMAKKPGNNMYVGCFYLFDTKILTLWPIIFRGTNLALVEYFYFKDWFIACQITFTCSFATYILAECVILTQAFGLFSFRGSRVVLCIMVTLSVNYFSTLISLITMGVGVDTEQKIESTVQSPWLEYLSQSSLSWSYGLAALSLLPTWITIILLGWFVYPKRSPCGLLINSAWDWPTFNDLRCRYHIDDMHTLKVSSYINPKSSCSNASLSIDHPYSLHSHSLIQPCNQNTCDQLSSKSENKILCKPTLFHKPRVQPEQMLVISGQDRSSILSDNGGKLSSYDPRSADTVSLLSYEQPPSSLLYPLHTTNMNDFNSLLNSKMNNNAILDYSPVNLISSSHKITMTPTSFFKKFKCEQPNHHHQQQQLKCITNSESQSQLKSTHSNKSLNFEQQISTSNPDTSIWTENKSFEKSVEYSSPIIQAARPMKRTKMKADRFMKKIIPSDHLFKFSSTFQNTEIQIQPNTFVQKAKPMNKK